MPKLAGVNHQAAIKALRRKGFTIARQGKHVTMKLGETILTVPRADPIKPYTMGAIIKAAGMTVAEFKTLLK